MTFPRSLLAAACLLLGACATLPQPEALPETPPPTAASESPPATTPPPEQPPEPTPEPAPTEPVPPPDGWQVLAMQMRFANCDEAAAVRRWIRVYTASPPRFEAMLRRALPFLRYVQAELVTRDLPGEFVLLPMVESSYVAFASKGNRPAGIWQFMPATARHFGLPVGADYDGRLDVAASTRAALEYLSYLGGQFDHDWTLVNMAFNAGEYRVRGALERARRGNKPVPHDQLALSPITHEHFAKLTALSCIVREPARWKVQLPPIAAGPGLAALKLDAATDLTLIAALARSDEAAIAAFNPAARGGRLPAGAMVLLPGGVADTTGASLARVPRELRTGWRRVDSGGRDWTKLAGSGADAALLVTVNGANADSPPPARVLVRSPTPSTGVRDVARIADAAGRYTVRSGDSLWTIARRFGVSVTSLLQWNALPTRHVLRPGQSLWIVAPR